MVHVLPGHAVHVPEVDVIGGVQLIKGLDFVIIGILVTGGRVELGAQARRHGNRKSHATVDMEGISFDIHILGVCCATRTDFPELIVAFEG